jgi:membrane fusion protein (multidrug efflux system)
MTVENQSSAPPTPADLKPRIARRAYELYEERAHKNGPAVEDWEQAEREIRPGDAKSEPKPEAKSEPKPGDQAAESKPAPAPPSPAQRKHKRTLILLGCAIVLVLATAATFYYLYFIAPFESTDDAFIEGHVAIVSPQVSGPVVQLHIHDNQMVQEGDLLLEIDPRNYETKTAQTRADLAAAQSQLEQAKAQVVVDEAKAAQQLAAVAVADAEARLASADLQRYQAVESRAVSQTQLDLEQTRAESTTGSLEVARNRARAATAQVNLSRTSVASAIAGVQQADAKLQQAELDLSYTKIFAPIAGRVTQRTVERGDYVMTAQSLLALVPTNMWIVANFKETQLARIHPGQSVLIRMDAYPGQKLKGKVESLQAGTGAQFSLLPPENAVGNYVKVVQRVPVRIIFDEPLPPGLDISPGMSVTPEVTVK